MTSPGITPPGMIPPAEPGTGPVGVAVVGCGTISDQYLRNLTSFPDLNVVICADLDMERAKAQAAAYGVAGVGSTAQAVEHPEVEIVVNLTVPAAHESVSAAAIAAGKSVWVEKPLTLDTESGRRTLAAADRAGVRVGCAPDTVLGAGLQTGRRLIESGAIGVPQTALVLFQGPGPESWHPDPAFLFQRGAGPLYDMGPYYLTALAAVFGPAESVAAVGRRSRDRRVIGSGPRAGTSFEVEVPTHVSALISYESGAAATFVLSFDSPLRRHGFIEVTGTEATLALPDPNRFDGDVRARTADDEDWRAIPAAGTTAGRGLGVLDLARTLRAGVPHRATGELGLHVLDILESIARSAASGSFVPVTTTFTVPPALEPGWDPSARTLAR
jgi:predicted dehydrogenase